MYQTETVTERQQAALWAIARIPYRVSQNYSRAHASALIDQYKTNPKPLATQDQVDELWVFGVPRHVSRAWSQEHARYVLQQMRDPAYR